jgi:hypothetical protein
LALSQMVGRVMKKFLLTPRVRKLNWEQLRNGALVSATRFDEMVAGAPESAADISTAGHQSLKDMVAHLAAANRSIAAKLEALRAGQSSAIEAGDLFPGAGAWSLAEARADHAKSLRRIAEATIHPIQSPTVSEHEFFGPLTATEWLALVAFHHEYHARQANRVMRSPEYKEAQGAKW